MKKPAIRIFISSTFLDMQKEREVLNQEVFPRLRSKCEKYGISFYAVDLRWGITEEAQKQNKVIDLCLDEIDHSRPFFIGLIGNRYGWIPDRIPEGALDHFPWIKNYFGKSVTEIEMCYGALDYNSQATAFYFKSPSLSIKEHSDKKDMEIEILKKRIVTEGKYHMEYNSIDQFKEDVYLKLNDYIEREYDLSNIDVKKISQEYYLEKDLEYYVRNEILEQSIEYVCFELMKGKPVVFYSEHIIGKSITLNNWINRQNGNKIIINLNAEKNIDIHYNRLFKLIMDGFKENNIKIEKTNKKYYNYEEIDSKDELLADDLSYLYVVLSNLKLDKPCFILINDINLLENNVLLKMFEYIPKKLNDNLFIILSTNSKKQTDYLYQFGLQDIDIEKTYLQILDGIKRNQTIPGINLKNVEDINNNINKLFFSKYLYLFGKSASYKDFPKIETFSLFQQKLMADYLIQFSNYETYRKDFAYLAFGEKGIEYYDEKQTFDLTFSFNNIIKLLIKHYEEEEEFYFIILLVRLANSRMGILENDLFNYFVDETDTLSLLGFSSIPKFKKNISSITIASVMQGIRFLFDSDDGIIKNKYDCLTKLILSNTEMLGQVIMPYIQKLYKDNFTNPNVDVINSREYGMVGKDNYINIFFNNKYFTATIETCFYDCLNEYYHQQINKLRPLMMDKENLWNDNPIIDCINVELANEVQFYINHNQPKFLFDILTDPIIARFLIINQNGLLKTAIYTYWNMILKLGSDLTYNKFSVKYVFKCLVEHHDYSILSAYEKKLIIDLYYKYIEELSSDLSPSEYLNELEMDDEVTSSFDSLIYSHTTDECQDVYCEYFNILSDNDGLDIDAQQRIIKIYEMIYSKSNTNVIIDNYVYKYVSCYTEYLFNIENRVNEFINLLEKGRATAHPIFIAMSYKLIGLYLINQKDWENAKRFLYFSLSIFLDFSEYSEASQIKNILKQL